jgi:hypothetical protein
LWRPLLLVSFAPSEVPPLFNLYVVMRGLVTYGTKLVRAGRYWGEARSYHRTDQ